MNGDSLQLYKGLPLLTAQPTQQDQACAPHYLYATASTPWTVMDWVKAVETCLETLGDQPVCVVGGTGFYLHVLIHGLCPLPPIEEEARQAFLQVYEPKDFEVLKKEGLALDPELKISDKRRLIYALMVAHLTGKTLSFWHSQPRILPKIDRPLRRLLIWPSKSWLRSKAQSRFHIMIQAGLWEEIKAFDAQTFPTPFRFALGLEPCLGYIHGKLTLKECHDQYNKIVAAYIRRQQTWFRHQFHPHTVCTSHETLLF